MPQDLFGQGAGLLETAGQTNAQTASIKQKDRADVMSSADNAGNNAAKMAEEKQKEESDKKAAMVQQAASEQLEKLKQKQGYVTIDGSMAMGMAKHTGNPSWLKMVGQEAPYREITALYTADMKAKEKEGTPKLVQLQDGDNVYHAYTWKDPDTGQMVQVRADKGGAKSPGSAHKGEADASKERGTFIKNYDTKRKQLDDVDKKLGYSPNDADLQKQKAALTQELSDDQPKYDQLKGKQAKGGGFNSDEVTPPPAADEIDNLLNDAAQGMGK